MAKKKRRKKASKRRAPKIRVRKKETLRKKRLKAWEKMRKISVKRKPSPQPAETRIPKIEEQKPKLGFPQFKLSLNISKKARKEAKIRKFLEKAKEGEVKPSKELDGDVIKQLIVADVMTKDPVTIKSDDKLSYIVRLFSNKKISGAPVISEGNIVGIITKSDIIKVIGVKDLLNIDSTGLKKLEDVKVSDIMRKKVQSVKRHTKIAEATHIMNKRNINILPVLDDKNRIVGVVSRGDIVRIVSKELLTKLIKDRRRLVKGMTTIETDIDSVLDIVEKEGSIGILKIKEKLMIEEDKIEEWAKILEKEGLIELYYPAFGSPILRKRIKDESEAEEE